MYNVIDPRSNKQELSGKGLLYEKGINWAYSKLTTYQKVHFNAAMAAGGAQLLRELKVLN